MADSETQDVHLAEEEVPAAELNGGPKEEPVEVPVLTKDTGSEEKKPVFPSTIDIAEADVLKQQLLLERVKTAQLTATIRQHEMQMAMKLHQDAVNAVNEFVDVLSKKYDVPDIGKYKLGDDGKLHLLS